MGWNTLGTFIKSVLHRPAKFHPDIRATYPLQLAKEHLPGDIIDILE